MFGIFENMMIQRFWYEWETKFNRTSDVYIDPDHPAVVKEAERLNINTNQSDVEIAERLWKYIQNTYDYKLTKKWKRPYELINSGIGDCEDYCFLVGSLLPHFGVNDFSIVAGSATSNGVDELHVWMIVDGVEIDPTAPISMRNAISYKPKLTFDINTNK